MSGFGIGLGGFMDGFTKGYAIRNDMDDKKLRNERLKTQDERQAKMDARVDLENQREDTEYNRLVTQRGAVDAVGAETKAKFDAGVAAGTQRPEDFDQFWGNYALPRLKQTYLANGDLENARKVSEWGETAAAKTGGKLFSSALLKAQTGDSAGALDDVIKAGQVKGYIEHGYELDGQEPLIDPEGRSIGFRLKVKDADGKIVEQDIRTEDLPRMIATFANPEAAWQSHIAAAAARAKDEGELRTYAAKKQIDNAYGVGSGNKGRGDAISSLRKRMDGGLDGSEAKFDDLPAEQKEKLINDELQLQQGTPGLGGQTQAAPQRKVIVDQVTGKVVNPAPDRSAVKQDSSPGRQIAEQGQPAAEPDKSEVMIGNAMKWIAAGEDPRRIAQQLLESGVPQDKWPPELRQALVKDTSVVGLGRR